MYNEVFTARAAPLRMSSLFRVLIDIALWRKGPQDLPASPFLLAMLTAIYVGVSFVQVHLFGWGFSPRDTSGHRRGD